MKTTERLLAASILAALVASSPAAIAQDLGACSTPERDFGEPAPLWNLTAGTPADCSASSNNPAPDYDPSNGLYTVQVVVHVILDSSCTNGDISDPMVQTQIDILNQDFLALPGTNGSGGADSQIRFELASEDPVGNPTNGITRDCNDTWFNDSGNYWETLAWDPHRYLNLYTNSAGGARGYVPFLPAQPSALVGDSSDRVVVNWQAFGTGGPVPAHQLGRTATHEIGHYLGLWHTYFNSCGVATPPDCYTTGDLICDTNPDEAASDLCPVGETSCGGFLVPIDNYMELTDDFCMDGFSAEQGMRMRCTLEHYRPGIFSSGSCGNGVREGGEECDGADLGGAVCADVGCASGSVSCAADCTLDYSACGDCGACDLSGVCDAGEDCNGCPADCPSFPLPAASCGNGLCEAGDGEDCVTCAQDCAGQQSGKPSGRFCCGFGGENPVGCGDPACGTGGWSCTETPQGSGGSTCCGDLICEGPEDGTNCAVDCGAPPACGDMSCDPGEDECSCSSDCGTPPVAEAGLCTDGVDNDCDTDTDCADADCAGDAACQPVDCSSFGDKTSCTAEPSCRWDNRSKTCVPS